ncbi:TonB-dependent receptor [Ferruginibacter lapsinanis]|uniref:TonB-dependent receptor n=1 Tax=Ferruginibacter lapsinanis TaxID=563172 RepID=UPI001E5E8D0C|nr:TonB-dependent receptor [Ferruginibacter lapsinanis]UEG50360.1 TonB-dependent receptor [Ferruginibacter lapsinanis]
MMIQFKPFLLSITVFLFFAFNTKANSGVGDVLKGSFTVTINDAVTGDPIEGVSVYFSDVKVGGSSNSKGVVKLENIPEGKHLIEISHIGYNTISEYVDIIGDTKKVYVLSRTVVENNAVIVTGTTGATQLKKVPFQVSVLKKEDLLQNASTNIIEALAKKPGVSTLSTGPAISKPVIRGLSYNRVLTINDGVRQEGQQWGDEHGIEIDEASVNKVEILKGPASLIYGSDATAGVINIITNVPVANNTMKANVFSNYQTNNHARTLNANLGGNKNGINWNVYGSALAASDYSNRYDGKVFNSKFNEQNFGGYAGYNGNWGYSHLLFSKFNLKAGLVEGERDINGYFIKPIAGGGEIVATNTDFNSTIPLIPYQNIQHFKIATDNSFKLGENRLSLNVGYQHNQREEFSNPDDVNERALFFDLKTITYAAHLHLKEMGGWKTAVGVNGMQQHNVNKGIEQLIPDYTLFDIGGYAFTQKTINKITLSGGARYDTRNIAVSNLLDGNNIKAAAFKRSFSNFSGSIGATVQVTKNLNLKVNIARGFRAPSIPELSSNGAHEGTIRYEYGQQNLKSELSTQLDGGFEFNTEHVSFDISGFYNSFSNFILYRKLQAGNGGDSTINIDGQELTAFKFEQTKAALSGIEMEVDIHPHPLDWLHIENTFSLVTGKLKEAIEGSNNLPFIPAPRLITEFRGNIKKIKNNIHNAYVKFEIDNTFTQNNIFTAYNTETRTSGYTLLNAGVGADIVSKKGVTLFSLHFVGTNLADVAYQNHLSRLKYAAENMATGRNGVFNMGRNFSVKFNVPLNWNL